MTLPQTTQRSYRKPFFCFSLVRKATTVSHHAMTLILSPFPWISTKCAHKCCEIHQLRSDCISCVSALRHGATGLFSSPPVSGGERLPNGDSIWTSSSDTHHCNLALDWTARHYSYVMTLRSVGLAFFSGNIYQ